MLLIRIGDTLEQPNSFPTDVRFVFLTLVPEVNFVVCFDSVVFLTTVVSVYHPVVSVSESFPSVFYLILSFEFLGPLVSSVTILILMFHRFFLLLDAKADVALQVSFPALLL